MGNCTTGNLMWFSRRRLSSYFNFILYVSTTNLYINRRKGTEWDGGSEQDTSFAWTINSLKLMQTSQIIGIYL